jgi:hypothetical protein
MTMGVFSLPLVGMALEEPRMITLGMRLILTEFPSVENHNKMLKILL